MLKCSWLIAFVLVVFSCAQAAPPKGENILLKLVSKNLDHPVDLTHAGDERLFVLEQPGKVRIIENGQLLPKPFLDLTDRVYYQGECGLLGIAFHPDFKKNGLFYVDYTTKQPKLHTVIAEFHVEPNANTVEKSTERIVLTIDQPFANHNGGQVAFGPDGMLYIGMGDGGSRADPHDAGQRLDTLLGKILRIDVSGKPYDVPKDNPFFDTPNAKPEIWAWGIRNAWRFSFDPTTGDCYCGDIGQDKFEEIDIITKGGNYGWRLREASHPFDDSRAKLKGSQKREDLIDPIAEYGRDVGQSVTGGFVYRGKKYPALDGVYFYGDYATGRYWGLRYVDGKVIANEELNVTVEGRKNKTQPSSFGVDMDGEIYVCDHTYGAIYRIEAPAMAKSQAKAN